MADISKITVNEVTYNIKDSKARQDNTELVASLGKLAYKDSASGTVTPSGTVTAPAIDVTPTSKTIKGVFNVGKLPTWSASVSEETLSFDFGAGELPTTTNETVLTGIANATATAPIFNGTETSVTVS